MDVKDDLNTYVRDTILLSKIAIAITRQDDSYIDMCIRYLKNNNNEGAYIDVCNIIFTYFIGQYKIASTDNEKDLVKTNMLNTFNIILNNSYIPREWWTRILSIRINNGNIHLCGNDIVWLVEHLHEINLPCTKEYINRRIANYIINGDMFFVEPYTSTLEKVLKEIDDKGINISSQPTYLN